MINHIKKGLISIWPLYLFCALAIFLIIPQLNRHSVIIGVDSIFHLNRFYDSMMQIKTGKFNYFMMNFGFDGTGRVVNALYGPIFAYIQGLILLISGTWFKYQLLSDVLLTLVSSCTMYFLCQKIKLSKTLSTVLAMLYSTSSVVAVWSTSQQFTGWGAAFFPLVIGSGLIFIKDKAKFKDILLLGVSVAILFQVHLLTTVIAVLALIPLFTVGISRSKHKIKLLVQTISSIIVFVLLTGNIWGPLLSIEAHDHMLGPWPYDSMSDFTSWFSFGSPFNTDIGHSPTYGLIFSIIVIGSVVISLTNWQRISILNKTLTITILIFVILTSEIIPWTYFSTKFLFLKEFLQFPRRFIVVPTVLSLSTLGLNLKELKISTEKWKIPVIILLVFSVCSIFTEVSNQSKAWNTNDISPWRNNLIFTKDPIGVRKAFTSHDLKDGLNAIKKYSMDYIPIIHKMPYDGTKLGPYSQSYSTLTSTRKEFKQRVDTSGNIILNAYLTKPSKKTLPIVMYNNTYLRFNGKRYTRKMIKTNSIMQPTLQLNKGPNKIKVGYHVSQKISFLFLISTISWLLMLLCFVLGVFQKF